ncbi:MAG TPA: protein kinase [Ktedonobacterales bacterium]|nr:protein kinase [Ktedonobacterales bacterium]
MSDRTGQQAGNYKLVKLLGKGGFAEVYLGEHIHLGTPAAIKLLTAKLSGEEENHFREEARTIAWLRHPNIVRVLEFGVEEGLPYLVMDYAPNGTLRQFFLKGWKYEPLTILPYVQQVAGALQFAHDRKLIHRDVKPENMLLGENKEVLLSDFGIAVVAQSSRHQDMQEVVGTLAYMAPEQIQAHPRPASDQYSLGVVIYEWLTGARPFSGSMSEILAKQISTPPAPLREKIPNVSPELEQIVLTALAKDPRERFASIRAFANAFEQAALAAQGATSATVAAPAPEIPQASPPGVGQANNIISAPSAPANSSPASNWPSFYAPSGPASTPSAPPISAGSGPYGNVISAPNAVPSGPYPNVDSAPNVVPSMPPGAAGGMASSTGPAADSSGPYGPPSASPANGESNILDAPTVMGTFLAPTAPAPPAQPVMPAAAGWQSSQPVPSAPPGWQTAQPIPSAPPGWQSSQPAFSSGPAQMDAPTLSSGPVGPAGPAVNPPPPIPAPPPTGRGISRRTVLVAGAAGIAGLAVVGGGITWFALSNKPSPQTGQGPTPPPDQPLYTYSGHRGAVRAVVWVDDGNRVASASADHTVQVWDALSGANSVIYHGHIALVRAITLSSNKQFLASASDDKTVQIWSLATNTRTFTYKGHTDAVLAVAWSPVGPNIASGGLDQTVQVWSSASNGKLQFKLTLTGTTNHATCIAWSPDGKRLAAGSADGTVRIWDVGTQKPQVTYRGHTAGVNSIAWSPDGLRVVSGGSDKRAIVWDSQDGKTYAKDHNHTNSVDSVAWSPDGKYIATASTDMTVEILDAVTYRMVRTYSGHKTQVLAVAWSPDSQNIASGGQDDTAQVWKALEA